MLQYGSISLKKVFWAQEARHRRVHTLWFIYMRFHTQEKLVFGANIRRMAILGQMVMGWGHGNFRHWPHSVSWFECWFVIASWKLWSCTQDLHALSKMLCYKVFTLKPLREVKKKKNNARMNFHIHIFVDIFSIPLI